MPATLVKHQTLRSARFMQFLRRQISAASTGCGIRIRSPPFWDLHMSNAVNKVPTACNCASNWVQYLREALGQLLNKRCVRIHTYMDIEILNTFAVQIAGIRYLFIFAFSSGRRKKEKENGKKPALLLFFFFLCAVEIVCICKTLPTHTITHTYRLSRVLNE